MMHVQQIKFYGPRALYFQDIWKTCPKSTFPAAPYLCLFVVASPSQEIRQMSQCKPNREENNKSNMLRAILAFLTLISCSDGFSIESAESNIGQVQELPARSGENAQSIELRCNLQFNVGEQWTRCTWSHNFRDIWVSCINLRVCVSMR